MRNPDELSLKKKSSEIVFGGILDEFASVMELKHYFSTQIVQKENNMEMGFSYAGKHSKFFGLTGKA